MLTKETPQARQKLHEALKVSKAAPYFAKIHWPEYSYRISLERPKATDRNPLLINIEADKQPPGRFRYEGMPNKFFNEEQAYYGIEQKDDATAEDVIEVVFRRLEPGSKWLYSRAPEHLCEKQLGRLCEAP